MESSQKDSIVFENTCSNDNEADQCEIENDDGVKKVIFSQYYNDDEGFNHTRSFSVPACVILEALKHFEKE